MSRTYRKNMDKDQKARKKCSTWTCRVRREGKK